MKKQRLTKEKSANSVNSVEEDGDEVFVKAKVCFKFGCDNAELMVGKNGFKICPKCKSSYGKF